MTAPWRVALGALVLAGAACAGEWRSLFDGATLAGWDDPGKRRPAGESWAVEDGWIVSLPRPRLREDLLTNEVFGDFEMEFEWRVDAGTNSGVKYRVQERVFLDLSRMPAGVESIQDQIAYEKTRRVSDRGGVAPDARGKDYSIGFEFQMIDDAGRAGDGKHATGALYDLVAPSARTARRAGEVNVSRIVVRGDAVEHWVNGVKVLEADLGAGAVKEGLAARWGREHPVFRLLAGAGSRRGRIALTQHGDRAWFRKIRIRVP